MNKGEIIAKLADQTEMTQKQVDLIITSFIELVKNEVAADQKVTITGFGTFSRRTRKGRTGRNPRTGEEIQIAETCVPAFSAGKQFKDTVKAGA